MKIHLLSTRTWAVTCDVRNFLNTLKKVFLIQTSGRIHALGRAFKAPSFPCNLSGNNSRWWQQRFSQWWVACFFESLWSLLRRTSCIVSQLVIHVWLLQLNINVNIWGWRNYRHWHSTGCAVPLRSQMIKLCWGGEVYQDFLKLHFSILSLQRSYF